MKKTAAVISALFILLVSVTANAAYSQYDIQTAAEKALAWHEEHAAPRISAGSSASDYYIMSLSRMNKNYDYAAYARLTEKINPSTNQDGQRLIMASAACGETLSDSFVGWYTYQQDNSSAAELAGTIITLDSGGYIIPEEYGNINNLVGRLLTTQQSNGSFGNDILTTAKAIIALSPRVNTEYQLSGTHDDELYKYNTNSAIENAVAYLSASQQEDGGYTTLSNTAYVITALDSIGTDADTAPAFIKNGVSPLGYILSMQNEDGSIASSADDTAMAEMALISHLRAMQGKSAFFSFTSDDSLSSAASAATENHSGEGTVSGTDSGSASSALSSSDDSEGTEIIRIAPEPTKEPEHSAVSEEEYGPFQFVGPVQQTEKPSKAVKQEITDGQESESSAAVVILAIIAAAALVGFVSLTIISRNPELKKKLEEVLASSKDKKEDAAQDSGENLMQKIDEKHEVVPTEELYDPDFIKKLIPVDEIDMSIDSLIPLDDEPQPEAENASEDK